MYDLAELFTVSRSTVHRAIARVGQKATSEVDF